MAAAIHAGPILAAAFCARYAISASQQGVCRAYDLVEDRVVRLSEPVAAVAVLDQRTALLALCDGQLRRVRVDVSARTDSPPTVS